MRCVALGLAADGQRLGQLVGGHRGDRVVHVFLVVREYRVLGGFLARSISQLLLRGTQRGDERLGRLKAFGHNAFGGRTGATVDQVDDIVGGFGLDHHDRDVIASLAAGHDHVEHGAFELLDGGERNPLAVDQRDPHAADGTGERQPGNLGRRRCGVDGQHVVQILGIQAQDRDHDLDLVTQARDERRAQWPVDEPAGQDRVGGRPALAPEERSGDTTGGIHPLLDVDRQGEEVEMVFRGLAGGGRAQQHGLVVEVGDDGAGGLLGQPAGLETDGAGAKGSRCRWWRSLRTRLHQFQLQT